MGEAVGISGPRSPFNSPPKPLPLVHEDFRHLFLVPSSLYIHTGHLKDKFLALLSKNSGQAIQDSGISSVEELVSQFLAYVAHQVETTHEDRQIVQDVLFCILRQFETDFLRGNEIHAVVASLPDNQRSKLAVIKRYYASLYTLNLPIQPYESSLLLATKRKDVKIFTIFGGQGNNEHYFSELREVFTTYQSFVHDFVSEMSELMSKLSELPTAKKSYPRGLKALTWLRNSDEEPESEYLISAPLSFPLIGLLQLSHIVITCKILGVGPRDLSSYIAGASGHSQGIIIAVAISQADSWDSFFVAAKTALTVLFWIGLRSQQSYPETPLLPSLIKESINASEGSPSPMLSVRNLSRGILQQQIHSTNLHLSQEKQLHVGLINGANNHVVCGPAMSLCGLNSRLRKIKSTPDVDQNRVPSQERKLNFTNNFLPVTAPFHSWYLEDACDRIVKDVHELCVRGEDLRVPVYSTKDGADLRSRGNENIVPELIRMVTCDRLEWEQATRFPGATHIVDFGPGGTLGIGFLTQKIKEGQGVRIVSATSIGGHDQSSHIGCKEEIFDRNEDHHIRYGANWLQQYGPQVMRTKAGETFINTKFSKLLGLPPVMVAGMTPCTVPWDFVAATMNAGYHVELAGGGYYSPRSFAEAIRKVAANVAPGRAVTLNLIYANPSAIAWQIPLIKKLRIEEGVPIDGVTFGAGVPTIEVASQYIIDLGLRHISFKPGSVESMNQVIGIAKSNPHFPIILQWTGGRGGGHHSFEDFHQPIIQMYGKIRDCQNIVLVAGSGFGGAEDTFPYLTGTWASKFGYPPMPFDGILFGSRMMTAKEAHTSHAVKQAIVDTEGTDDSQWEATYKSPSGGVITVLSEMREPIHKIATRGVRLWAKMDQMIFSLERSKRLSELSKNRDYIIKHLNVDYQKVWFGKKTTGQPVEIEEMTYSEVLCRMADLLYIEPQSRWIDSSYEKLLNDFARRVEERFLSDCRPSLVQDVPTSADPSSLVKRILGAYPRCKQQLVSAQDVQFFLQLCKRRGQKPVPFIPALDEDFEYWFKKDSLWQSEDLEAVVGQDVGRTCILQGPVAVRHNRVVDEPIKNILDQICQTHIQELTQGITTGSGISEVDYIGGKPLHSSSSDQNDHLLRSSQSNTITYRFSRSDDPSLPEFNRWLDLLAGDLPSWRHTFFKADTLVQGHKVVKNPFKRLFAATWNIEVHIEHPDEPRKTSLILKERVASGDGFRKVIELKATKERHIGLTLFEHRSVLGSAVGLTLDFFHSSGTGFAPILEIMEGRNDRIKAFYWRLWFGDDEKPPPNTPLKDEFAGGTFTIEKRDVADFTHAVGNMNEAYVEKIGKDTYAPMDFAIKAAWKGMTMPVFLVDGNLLDLVHLSNGFRMLPGAQPLRIGDVLQITSSINAIRILTSGKMVEVRGTVTRENRPIMDLRSSFLYRGAFSDHDSTFEMKTEVPTTVQLNSTRDVTLLRSREWLHLKDPGMDLLNQSLTFHLKSMMKFKSKDKFSSIHTSGRVLLHSSSGKGETEVGTVEYNIDESLGNPVLDFMRRHGSPIEQRQIFTNAIPLNDATGSSVQTPSSNELYAKASGDFNPIHVSRIIADYAGLEGTITHGMYTSASVRGIVEMWAADNEIGRMKSFECSFEDMLLPNERIDVKLWHVGMLLGRKIIKVEATKASGQRVLTGEAEVEQPPSAYIFTGQGSQDRGMGMDLYAQNNVARLIWDRADKHFFDNYGFSIIEIVRNNPKVLKIHFGGPRGRLIRQNYIRMTVEKLGADGRMFPQKVFKDIDNTTASYVFSSPQGLLYSTQFAQPALTLVAKAIYAVQHEKGLIQEHCSYAGHSLGEYAALSAFSDFMSVEDLMSIVFYRGLTMQLCVERDEFGRTNYSMCAINPSKVSKDFDEQALRYVLQNIQQETHWLLEVVNLNIQDVQYVCAGDLRALDTLISVTNHLAKYQSRESPLTIQIPQLVRTYSAKARSKPKIHELERGLAATPLRGIDVPFHSSYLRSGICPFRSALKDAIKSENIDMRKLIDKYIPNLTGKPFQITKGYFEEVGKLTGSEEIEKILREWNHRPEAIPT